MSQLKANFVSGLLSGAGSFLLKAVSTVLLVPYLIQYLGTESFGFFIFLLSFSELLLIMDAGLTSGLIHRLSHYLTVSDHHSVTAHIQLGQVLYGGVTLALMAIGLALSPLLAAWFPFAHTFNSTLVTWAFGLVFIDAAMNLYSCFYQSVLKAHCLHKWTNATETFRGVVTNVVAVLLVINGYNILAVLVARLVTTTLATIAIALKASRVQPRLLTAGWALPPDQLKALMSISGWSLVQRVSVFLSLKANDFIIATFLTLTDMALYGLVYRIFTQVIQFSVRLLEGLSPVFIRFVSSAEHDKSRFFFLRMTSVTHFMASAAVLLILTFYPQIIGFMGSGQVTYSDTIPLGLLFAVIVWSAAVSFPASNYLFSASQQRYLTTTSLITAAVGFVLALVLVKPFGLTAVAMSTLIPQLVRDHGFLIQKTRRMLGLSLGELIETVLIKSIPALLVLVAVAVGGRWAIEGGLLPAVYGIMAFSMIAGILAALVWMVTAASPTERDWVTAQINTLLKRYNLINNA